VTSADDVIYRDFTPGMRLTIDGASRRYKIPYSTAQKALRRLWHGEMILRRKEGRVYVYEGKQERLM
jgi:hypothetical protein